MNQSEAEEVIGVPQRTISKWIETGLLDVEKKGRGYPYELSMADLLQASTIRNLREQGASMQAVRPAIEQLREYGIDDWQSQWLFVSAEGEILWFDSDREALLQLRDSQGYCVDVIGIKEQLETDLCETNRATRGTVEA